MEDGESIVATIVTLVDLEQRPHQILSRLEYLAGELFGTEFSLVVGLADRDTSLDKKLKERIRLIGSHVKLVSVSPRTNNAELSRLRNEAMRHTTTDVVLLADVDIFPDLDLFRSMVRSVAQGSRLEMSPCIYLTDSGNRLVAQGCKNKVIESALAFNPDFVLHWAIPSSVIALRRDDYWAIDGFYEGYQGHGYEDFDFMLRHAVRVGLIEPSTDLGVDRTYRAPFLGTGFRGELGRLCTRNLLAGNIAFHLYHESDPVGRYKKRRVDNAQLFQQRLLNLLGDSKGHSRNSGYVPVIADEFFSECKRQGVSPDRFYALFDARPRHLLRPRGLFKKLKVALNILR